MMGGDFTPWTEFCWGGTYARWGGDFLAKALDPEGPPPAQKTLDMLDFWKAGVNETRAHFVRNLLGSGVNLIDANDKK